MSSLGLLSAELFCHSVKLLHLAHLPVVHITSFFLDKGPEFRTHPTVGMNRAATLSWTAYRTVGGDMLPFAGLQE